VAGKTGTTEKSAAAWFVGYVPQLSTAVTLFDRKNQPITSIPGYGSGVYGGQIPAQIWQNFMLRATHNLPVKQFTPPRFTEGTRQLWDSPRPSPSPTPQVPDCRGQKRFTDPACQENPNPNPTENCGGFFQPKCPEPTQPVESPGGGGGGGGGGGQCPITDPNCRNNNNDDPTTTQSRTLTPARTEE
jgi:membrane peptidoglycan carboxypeptidase